MARRVKLVIAYHGRSFHGWQKQTRQRTVQGELEEAISGLFRGHRMPVVGAGRTDSGVHAAGQVVHFDPPGPIPNESLVRGINARLPPEIRARSARSVGPTFHARKSALGKLYTYRVRWRAPQLPWHDPLSAEVPEVVNVDELSLALELLKGRRDWASFTVPDPETDSTVRTLFHARIDHRRNGIDLDFVGDGFLRYQVRRMVGALLEVGSGVRSVDELRELVDRPTPGAPIRTAPASGLCLEHVYYRSCGAVRQK